MSPTRYFGYDSVIDPRAAAGAELYGLLPESASASVNKCSIWPFSALAISDYRRHDSVVARSLDSALCAGLIIE